MEIRDAVAKRESDSGKALLIDSSEFDEPVWVPKSAITDDSEIWEVGQGPGTLVVEEWLARMKGWI